MATTTSTTLLSGKPKPWLNTEPKPWHLKTAAVAPQPIQLEILESKRPALSPKKDAKEEDFIVLSCVDAEVVVPESIARISGLVCSILDSSGTISISSSIQRLSIRDYIEKQTRTIRFEHISAAALEEVIRFCTQECQENASFLQTLPPSPLASQSEGMKDEKVLRTSFVFELKPELVMELMAAAEYMQIPSLVSHIINMLAAYAEDVPSFEGMSESLVQQVCNKCKPSSLRKIEIDGKLDHFPKDFTTHIWRRFCGEYEDVVVTSQKECRKKEFEHSKYIVENNNNNDTAAISSSEEIDWRRGHAELVLESIWAEYFVFFLRL